MSQQLAGDAQRGAMQAAANPWLRSLGRAGYLSIGLVYLLVGLLALRVAAGPGGENPDQSSALQQILAAPFGRALLGLIAVGLFGYLIWRLIDAVADLRDKGDEPDGLGARAAHALGGLAYGALGVEAARLALGAGAGQGGQQEWTARLMSLPLGRWLVGLAGLAVIAVGLYQLYKGWARRFREDLAYGRLSDGERRLVDPVGVAGHLAHGIVLGLTGGFLVQAALSFSPDQARGLGGALDELARQPYGPWLLGLTALGLAAYGLYKIVEARYRRGLA